MDSMLLCCGEVGYRRVAVEQVYRRYGGYRSQFYKHFRNKAECFIAAYETEAGWLCDHLLSFAEADGQRENRLRDALEALALYVIDQPIRAKALFFEVHVVGPEAHHKRLEVFERLAYGLDRACLDRGSSPRPPRITAEFMIHTIDQAVSRALADGEPQQFADAIPDLAALICHTYWPDRKPN